MANITIQDLGNDILRIILEHIALEPEKLISLERRAYLSQESFRQSPPLEPDQAQYIAAFRLTCRKFSDLGVIHQFSRVTTRFSKRGLERLENIAKQPHIAERVKKFSYMVPNFYVEGREHVRELIQSQPETFPVLDVGHFQRKVEEQKYIVKSRMDARVLKTAISAFTSLQHVQILRVQDHQDEDLLRFIHSHPGTSHLVELNWPPACLHSAKTIGAALLETASPCSRFSSPVLSPQSVLGAAHNTPSTLSLLAERLTCLELHFDGGFDLDERMRQLSPLSRAIFTAAKNLEAVHIGFPSQRPLTLPLEDIFHNVRWDRLRAFGIQGWRLSADEITALVGRHRETLRGLRLRDVLLKDGSRWEEVLLFLRDNLRLLDWVSLRRAGYAKHFDDQTMLGAEVPDELGSDSSSSDESEEYDAYDDDDDDYDVAPDDPATNGHNTHTDADGSDNSVADTFSDAGTDEPEQGGALHLPMPDTPASGTWCGCNGHMDSIDVLHDDGVMVTNQQRKFWEKWVIRKVCTEQHDHK